MAQDGHQADVHILKETWEIAQQQGYGKTGLVPMMAIVAKYLRWEWDSFDSMYREHLPRPPLVDSPTQCMQQVVEEVAQQVAWLEVSGRRQDMQGAVRVDLNVAIRTLHQAC